MNRPFLSLVALVFLSLCGCRSAATMYEMGNTFYLQGNYEASLHHYREARRKDPTMMGIDEKIRITEIRLYLQRGELAVQRRQWIAAERAYGEIRRLDPTYPELAEHLRRMSLARADEHYRRGQQLALQGNPYDAIGEFEQALIHQPDHARAREALDRARGDRQDRERRAETAFDEGQRAWNAGRRQEALDHFTRALELNPHHLGAKRQLRDTRTRMGESLVREGDGFMERREWKEALESFRNAREHDPQLPGLEDRIQRAEREVRAATLVAEGNRAFDRGDWEIAFRNFHEAWQLSSDRERFRVRYETAREQMASRLYSRARAAEQDRRFDEALELYGSLRTIYPGYRDVEHYHARLNASLTEVLHAYEVGCRAQEARDLLRARDQFSVCRRTMPRYRDLEHRHQTVLDAISRAEDIYNRAVEADSHGDHDRALRLYQECLSISTPFRDASERVGRLNFAAVDQEYREACRAQTGRDLVRARKLFLACQRRQLGYRDVAQRHRRVEAALARARRIFQRAVQAEQRSELDRARDLYEECLVISTPYSGAGGRLERITAALQALEEARQLERERRLLTARERYRQVLKLFPAHTEAQERLREIDTICNGLATTYRALLVAQRSKKYHVALTRARKIRERCIGFKDVDKRFPMLETEVDYADAREFENKKQFEKATSLYERCVERTPGFRDVKERLRRCRGAARHHDHGVRDHGTGPGRRGFIKKTSAGSESEPPR